MLTLVKADKSRTTLSTLKSSQHIDSDLVNTSLWPSDMMNDFKLDGVTLIEEVELDVSAVMVTCDHTSLHRANLNMLPVLYNALISQGSVKYSPISNRISGGSWFNFILYNITVNNMISEEREKKSLPLLCRKETESHDLSDPRKFLFVGKQVAQKGRTR